jgi:hypothetical protein
LPHRGHADLAHRGADPSRAQDSDQVRYYLGLRVGETNPLINAKDLIGFSLGVNLGLHVGVELSVR